MVNLESVRTLLGYSDWANARVLTACAGLDDEPLDRPFDMGRGSLRRTLMHIWAGEHVWLQRWQGRSETPWPDESERVAVTALTQRFAAMDRERDAFLRSVQPGALERGVVYRDSKGSLFRASLGDMLVQACTHSTHHRAQCVNMLRRLGGAAPELDYMMWVRRPAEG